MRAQCSQFPTRTAEYAALMMGLILNPRARDVARHGVDHVHRLITAAVPDTHMHVITKGDDLGARCRAFLADGATAIVAAGGDGTVSSVAAHLVGTSTPLGILPLGTLNHFARDVGVGRDIRAAARALAGHSRVISVDTAEVNGRLFLNNASIGLYAHIVETRERHERHLGKWRALVTATLITLREGRPRPLVVTVDGESMVVDTYLLFVGNNHYEINLLRMGQRPSLDTGDLSLFVLAETRWRQLAADFAAAARAQPLRSMMFKELYAREVTVAPLGMDNTDTIEVACDGEIARLQPPLVYRVRPRSLHVLVSLHD